MKDGPMTMLHDIIWPPATTRTVSKAEVERRQREAEERWDYDHRHGCTCPAKEEVN